MDISARSAWGTIQGVRLELDEISTAAAIAKHSGSIFSCKENTNLLDAIEKALDIRIHGIPFWLKEIELTRSAVIRGARMRSIEVPRIMEELDVYKLSGLAMLVVLSCRYSEDDATMTKMVEMLIAGKLGNVFKVDLDCSPSLPYTFRGHIGAFIASCVDADRDSDVSRRASGWMSQLSTFGDLGDGWTPRELLQRRQQASIDLVGELLGTAGADEAVKHEHDGVPACTWGRVHNTLHLTCAYIALAAAAHGALILVECVTASGSRFFPADPGPEEHKSRFLVRLWLTQPPEHIRGILRHSEHENKDAAAAARGDPENNNVIVVGGTLEIATWVARKLHYRCKSSAAAASLDESVALSELWKRGVAYGRKMRWTTRRTLTTKNHGTLLLALESGGPDSGSTIVSTPEVASLSRALVGADKRLRPLATVAASIVHESYGLSDYSSLLSPSGNDAPLGTRSTTIGESEAIQAMYFVITAISIEALRCAINPAVGDTTDSYALNLATLDSGTRATGNLHNLVRSALNEGTAPHHVLCAAATVWGGAQLFGSSSNSLLQPPAADHMLGIIGPRCTVIWDMVRDPLAFVGEDRTDRLISIWRGSMPMLPRDPRTNCVYGGAAAAAAPTELGPDDVPKKKTAEVKGPMVVTFEPFDREATRGVFCFWHRGNLVCEFAPQAIFTTVLSGSTAHMAIMPQKNRPKVKKFVELEKADLLDMAPGGFRATRGAGVVIKGLGRDPAWAMFALGSASGPSTSSHHLLMHIDRGDPSEFRIDEFGKIGNDGQVVVLIG
ncbi:hypothetical protein QBC37DRAFT_312869 [Rhypophila decipiens]|uniref:Uncharacterized protein n=1 Tax=Rhypophila decipiens TaxID=261697 RepID=A0AAN7BBQ6_9PEZI|nr:hypothetical protein QBC37DRAFT_312869 [Rhypophila decipiens]